MSGSPRIALMVITDRPEYLSQTLASSDQKLPDVFCERVLYNDSAAEQISFPGWRVRNNRGPRSGFDGAVRAAWDAVSQDIDFIFHLEDDFVFEVDVPVLEMAAALDEHPYLQQIALMRQPWNEAEVAAGGIVQLDPDAYVQKSKWFEHRKFFTTNPCLYRASLRARGWPEGAESEGRFGLALFEDPGNKCAFWGKKDDPPKVRHIGRIRTGRGY